MEKCKMYQVDNHPRAPFTSHKLDYRNPNIPVSKYRENDYAIRMVCMGCKRKLGKYENIHGLAFCYECLKNIFPKQIESSIVINGEPQMCGVENIFNNTQYRVDPRPDDATGKVHNQVFICIVFQDIEDGG